MPFANERTQLKVQIRVVCLRQKLTLVENMINREITDGNDSDNALGDLPMLSDATLLTQPESDSESDF